VRVLHTYKPVDVPGTHKVRHVVYELSHVIVRANGDESVIPQEVWSTAAVSIYDHDEVSRTRRQAFEETCRRNGAKPRQATFQESIAYAAQLKQMQANGVSP
jgi:hypothetical protein